MNDEQLIVLARAAGLTGKPTENVMAFLRAFYEMSRRQE